MGQISVGGMPLCSLAPSLCVFWAEKNIFAHKTIPWCSIRDAIVIKKNEIVFTV